MDYAALKKTNKQTNKQKQQLEWIQSGSVVYFKVRNCLVLRPKCIVDREGPGRRRLLFKVGLGVVVSLRRENF